MHLSFLASLLLIVFASLQFAIAQETEGSPEDSVFKATSEVHYSWSWSSKPMEDGAESEKEERDEFFERVMSTGSTEEDARKELAKKLTESKRKAREQCRRLHENLAGCITDKLTSMSSVMGKVSFSVRKQLEDAVGEDCQNRTGRCTGEKSSEPVIEAPAVVMDEEGEGGGKKGKKKK